MLDNEIELQLEKILENKTGPCSRNELKELLESTKDSFNDYRLEHTRRVVKLAKMLSEELNADTEVVVFAAWLHDISKPGFARVENHGRKSAEIAEEILKNCGVDSITIEKVKDVICKHVGYSRDVQLEPLEAQILWESDKLDKIGVTGFIQAVLNYAILDVEKTMVHFAKDLRDFFPLAKGIVDSMFTPIGKRIANERYEHLKQLASLLEYEITNHLGEEMPDE